MITWERTPDGQLVGYGLSTDTAPTMANKAAGTDADPYAAYGKIPNGTALVLMDSSSISLYSAASDEWMPWG